MVAVVTIPPAAADARLRKLRRFIFESDDGL
jgi:hypothetical protein